MATARTRSSPRCCCTSQTSTLSSSPSPPADLGRREVDLQRAVDRRQLVGEDGLDHDALDLLDAADVGGRALPSPPFGSSGLRRRARRAAVLASMVGAPSSAGQRSPSAPATTSMISWVISAWRWRLAASTRSSISSAGVVRRAAHGGHAGAVLRRRGLEQRTIDRDLHVVGRQALEDLLRARLVDPQGAAVLALVLVLADPSARRPRRRRVLPAEDVGLLEREERLVAHLLAHAPRRIRCRRSPRGRPRRPRRRPRGRAAISRASE